MIHILFVPGSFGTMVEWGIQAYSSQFEDPKFKVKDDGSMHTHHHMCHINKFSELSNLLEFNDKNFISTTIHPMKEGRSEYIIKFFSNPKFINDKKILIDITDILTAEIIILMQYYKISIGSGYTIDSIFDNDYNKKNILNWNSEYHHWQDMEQWELREWFSMYYPGYTQQWINAKSFIDDSWLLINPLNLVYNYKNTIKKIIDFCELDFVENTLADKTSQEWVKKQLLIIEEHGIIDQIVKNTLNKVPFDWEKQNIIKESMIQKKLEDNGYKIRCYQLNDFPKNSIELFSLLEKQ